MGGRFWAFLAVVLVFTLGNSTDAFLLLRAKELGVPVALAPIRWAVSSGVKSVSNIPGGALSDRIGRRPTLVAGWAVYALVYFLFARATQAWHAWALFAMYGIFFGLTEGGATGAGGRRRSQRAARSGLRVVLSGDWHRRAAGVAHFRRAMGSIRITRGVCCRRRSRHPRGGCAGSPPGGPETLAPSRHSARAVRQCGPRFPETDQTASWQKAEFPTHNYYVPARAAVCGGDRGESRQAKRKEQERAGGH